MSTADLIQRSIDRQEGRVPNGDVWLLDFDLGVVETLGSVLIQDTFYLKLSNTAHAAEYPGVPVVFDSADNAIRTFKLPVVVVQRTGLQDGLERLHPSRMKYRAPAPGAIQFQYQGVVGYDKYVEQEGARPYDITYSIQILARNRGTIYGGTRNSTIQGLLRHLMKTYPHYSNVWVRDSLDGMRQYSVFAEPPESENELVDVTGRIIGYRMSLRVEGELDLNDPYVVQAVTAQPTLGMSKV